MAEGMHRSEGVTQQDSLVNGFSVKARELVVLREIEMVKGECWGGRLCPLCCRAQSKQVPTLDDLECALGSPLDKGPQAPRSKPSVLVISGPSGVGKDAVIKRLQEVRKEIHFLVTCTTRAKRPGEVEGVDYYFVTKQKFEEMIDQHELLEHALVYGDYKGIPKGQLREQMSKGKDVILRLDVQGSATIRKILGHTAVFIFLVAESEEALVKRLVDRKTDKLDNLLVRVATARDELKMLNLFDYVVENAHSQLERTVHKLCSILDAEKSRVHQRDVIL